MASRKPEQRVYDAFVRETPPSWEVQRIETSTANGVPDVFLQGKEIGALWLETKTYEYPFDNMQINWWIRYVRAGGVGGAILPAPNPPQKTARGAAVDASHAIRLGAHRPIYPPVYSSASDASKTIYIPFTNWPANQIEAINKIIKDIKRGIIPHDVLVFGWKSVCRAALATVPLDHP